MENPQHQLLAELSSGKEKAFITIYERTYPTIMRAALAMYRGDQQKADDLVQDVYTKVWAEPRKFENITDIDAYLFRTAKNIAADAFEKELRERLVQVEFTQRSSDSVVFQPDTTHIDPIDDMLSKVKQLPPKMKEVFERRAQGQSAKEIADSMNVSEDTVKMQLKRGKNRLRESIDGMIAVIAVLISSFY